MAVQTEYSTDVPANPRGICYGPDGNFWFANNTYVVGKITVAGSVSTYNLSNTTGWSNSGNIVSDGTNLWTTGTTTNNTDCRLYKVTTSGSVSQYTPPDATANPVDVAYGSDGRLWVLGNSTNKVYAYDPVGASWTTYSTGISASANLQRICAGPDGNLWFTEYGRACVAKITTGGTVTEYTTGISASSNPYYICSGTDGNVWFTERSAAKVAKITTSGTVTETSVGTGTDTFGIVDGGDGNLWVSSNANSATVNKIIKVNISNPTVQTTYQVTTGGAGITYIASANAWTLMAGEYPKQQIIKFDLDHGAAPRQTARQAVTRAATR